MSYIVNWFRKTMGKSDQKRNDAAPKFASVEKDLYTLSSSCRIAFYYLKENKGKLLVPLVIVHGGAWIYADLDTYEPYAKFLASQGFLAICFDYPLSPEVKHPEHLRYLDLAMQKIQEKRDIYHIDLEHIFLIGDSAGASMAVQYCIASKNHDYGILFPFAYPLSIAGLVLNCGTYIGFGDRKNDILTRFIAKQVLPKRYDKNDPRINPVRYLSKKVIPPMYLMTSDGDFLRNESLWFHERCQKLGISHEFHDYHSNNKKKYGHVFHLDPRVDISEKVNKAECDWIKETINRRKN